MRQGQYCSWVVRGLACVWLASSCSPVGTQAAEPSARVQAHLGKAMVDFVQRAVKAEAYRVGNVDAAQPGAGLRVGLREILGEPVQVDKGQLQRLVDALLSDNTYFMGDSKGTKTAVGFRLWTETNECAEVSCCLVKGNVCICVKDAAGKVLASGDRRGFRDDRASPMRLLAAELFPNDKEVQATRPKPATRPPLSTSLSLAEDEGKAPQEKSVYTTKVGGVQVEIFIPPGVKTLRGVVVHAANYGLPIKTNDRWAELGREIAFAHVAMRMDLKATNRGAKLHEALIEGLAQFAKDSGHPELATVPLAGVGHSAGGLVLQALHLSPERMLTVCVDCGWVSDPEKWPASTLGVPALFTMGAIPDAFKMLPSIEQHYDPARKKGLPWGLGVQWGCAHDFANAGALQVPWIRAVARARIDAAGKLQPVKLEEGWLGDRKSIDGQFATVASWKDYKGDRSAASWFPDREMAYLWRAWQTKDSAVVLEAAAGEKKLPAWSPKVGRGLTIDSGKSVELGVSVREGKNLSAVLYFDGDRQLGETKAAPWTFIWAEPAAGTHVLWAMWIEADGKLGAANPATVIVRQP